MDPAPTSGATSMIMAPNIEQEGIENNTLRLGHADTNNPEIERKWSCFLSIWSCIKKKSTGGWIYASLLLANQSLAPLAFFGVGVYLVLFLTRVLGQDNAAAANNVSIWTGTVYLFALVAAFLRDSYWGCQLTCAVCQAIFVVVFVATARKWNVAQGEEDELYEVEGSEPAVKGSRKIRHSNEFKCSDNAATMTENDGPGPINRWKLCTVTQVEELKWVIGMMPIWLYTIIYWVILTQMASLFMEQGAVMNSKIGNFRLPAACMSTFDICSVLICTLIYQRILVPIVCKLSRKPEGLTELQRMGIGLCIGMLTTAAACVLEIVRLKRVIEGSSSRSLSIFWQIPLYVLLGASKVFLYVGMLEVFNRQAPDEIKSFGSSLCMASVSIGNYITGVLVHMVMGTTARGDKPGWIPEDHSNHVSRLTCLIVVLSAVDCLVYVSCLVWYKRINSEESNEELPKDAQADVLNKV